MKHKGPSVFTIVLACSVLFSTMAFAQLGEPANDLGVRLGHVHLTVKDVDAHKRFWTEMLGGTLVKNGPLTMIQFPGVFVVLQQGQSTAPPAGSAGGGSAGGGESGGCVRCLVSGSSRRRKIKLSEAGALCPPRSRSNASFPLLARR